MTQKDRIVKATIMAHRIKSLASSLRYAARGYGVNFPLEYASELESIANDYLKNEMTMAYTKEEFKKLWESNEDGGGITFEDVAECAKAWGINPKTRCADINVVMYRICEAAGVKKEDMPPNPHEENEDDNEAPEPFKLTAEYAWLVYNFINRYKLCDFGFIPLQEAIDKYFDDYNIEEHEKKFDKKYF